MHIVDVYHDPEKHLVQRFPYATLPDFVKQAADASSTPLPDTDYALVITNDQGEKYGRYPINDLGNTFLSAYYLMEHGRGLPSHMQKVAATRIVQAFRFFDAPPPPTLEKLASADPVAPFVPEEAELPRVQATMTPLRAVVEGTYFFKENREELPPEEKRRLANVIEKQASALGVAVDPEIRQYAATEKQDPLLFRAAIERRREFVSDQKDLSKLAAIEEMGQAAPPVVLSALLNAFDRETSLNLQYDKIPDPIISAFGEMPSGKAAWKWDGPDIHINAKDLQNLANHPGEVSAILREPEDFLRDPVAAFEKLPEPLKVVLGRRAYHISIAPGEKVIVQKQVLL